MRRIESVDFETPALAPPFFLVVVDYDTQRFALAGPVSEIVTWEQEVTRIRRAGRDVWLMPVDLDAIKPLTDRLRNSGCEEWPSHSIVDLPPEAFPNRAR